MRKWCRANEIPSDLMPERARQKFRAFASARFWKKFYSAGGGPTHTPTGTSGIQFANPSSMPCSTPSLSSQSLPLGPDEAVYQRASAPAHLRPEY